MFLHIDFDKLRGHNCVDFSRRSFHRPADNTSYISARGCCLLNKFQHLDDRTTPNPPSLHAASGGIIESYKQCPFTSSCSNFDLSSAAYKYNSIGFAYNEYLTKCAN